ncbi:MAG: hypothetical protein HKN02_14460 [Rhodobacteraceae bacterium]|nr:hypothetical protein [Paracoccaceae bacterium]
MTGIYPEACPACGQGIVHPVHLTDLGHKLWLCDECDAIWPLDGPVSAEGSRVDGAGALYALTEAAGIVDYQTPILCLLTGLDLKDPGWSDAFCARLETAAKDRK